MHVIDFAYQGANPVPIYQVRASDDDDIDPEDPGNTDGQPKQGDMQGPELVEEGEQGTTDEAQTSKNGDQQCQEGSNAPSASSPDSTSNTLLLHAEPGHSRGLSITSTLVDLLPNKAQECEDGDSELLAATVPSEKERDVASAEAEEEHTQSSPAPTVDGGDVVEDAKPKAQDEVVAEQILQLFKQTHGNADDFRAFTNFVLQLHQRRVDDLVQAEVESLKVKHAHELKTAQEQASKTLRKTRFDLKVDLYGAEEGIDELEKQVRKLQRERFVATTAPKNQLEVISADSKEEGSIKLSCTTSEDDVEDRSSTPLTSSDEEQGPESKNSVTDDRKETPLSTSPVNEDQNEISGPSATVVATEQEDDEVEKDAEDIYEEYFMEKCRAGEPAGGLNDILKFAIRRKNRDWRVVVESIETSASNELQDLKEDHGAELQGLREEKEETEAELRAQSAKATKEFEKHQATISRLEADLEDVRPDPNQFYDKKIARAIRDSLYHQENALNMRAEWDDALHRNELLSGAFAQAEEKLKVQAKELVECKAQLDEYKNAEDLRSRPLQNEIADLKFQKATESVQIIYLLRENQEVSTKYFGLIEMMSGKISRSDFIEKLKNDLNVAREATQRELAEKLEVMKIGSEGLKYFEDRKKASKELEESLRADIESLTVQTTKLSEENSNLQIELTVLRSEHEKVSASSSLCFGRIEDYENEVRILRHQLATSPIFSQPTAELVALFEEKEILRIQLGGMQDKINTFEEDMQDLRRKEMAAMDEVKGMTYLRDKYDVLMHQRDIAEADNRALRERFANELKEKPSPISQEEEECAEAKLERLKLAMQRFTTMRFHDNYHLLRYYEHIKTYTYKPWHVWMLSEEKRIIRGIHKAKKYTRKVPDDLLDEVQKFGIDVNQVPVDGYFDEEKFYPLAEQEVTGE